MCTGSNFTLPFLSCCGHLCANAHLTICFSSVSTAITWLFVGFLLQDQCVLHLLAWPEDTNSPEGHFWVMPCRIPGLEDEQDFTLVHAAFRSAWQDSTAPSCLELPSSPKQGYEEWKHSRLPVQSGHVALTDVLRGCGCAGF